MKRNILILLALGAALVTGGYALGQGQAKSGPAPAQQQQKLLRVATLNGVDANREFQANVQLVQAQRQTAIELSAKMEQEKNARKKAELKKQLDEVMAKLNENNARMQKAYGFSLARNYTLVVETAHIYMFVTDEEAAKIEQAEKAEKAKKAKSGKK